MKLHAPVGRRHPLGHRLSRIRSCRSSGITTRTGMAPAIRTAWPARRFRLGRGSSWSWTASTRSRRTARTGRGSKPPRRCKCCADRRGTMYDPRVVDGFLAMHAAGLTEDPPPSVRAPVADPHATPVVATTAEPDPAPRDLAAFYSLGRELAMPGTGAREIGEAIWTSLSDELGAAACVLFWYRREHRCAGPGVPRRRRHGGCGRSDRARRAVERLGRGHPDADRQLRRPARCRSRRARGQRPAVRAGGSDCGWRTARRRAGLLFGSPGCVHASAPAHGGSRGGARRRARLRRTRRAVPGAVGSAPKQHQRVSRSSTPVTLTPTSTQRPPRRRCTRRRVSRWHTRDSAYRIVIGGRETVTLCTENQFTSPASRRRWVGRGLALTTAR